jgi:hypothetical protein
VKHRLDLYVVAFVLCGFFLFAVDDVPAQTIAYRQTNLASNVPNVANNLSQSLVNPWGLAFLSDQPFFIADNNVGHVTSLDATGLSASPGAFVVPNLAGTGFDNPTGILADQNSFFGGTRIGGQVFYWFFLRHQTHDGTLYWEVLQLRLGGKLVEEG